MGYDFLLYGANGYTGALVAREAAARGLKPLLAGRSAEKLAEVARPLGLDYRAVPLDAGTLDAALRDTRLVVHCAGPFAHTSRAMADACLRTKRHYVDVTGEVDVFESLAARDAEARAAGVMLLPGGGFDVVPSDCLAAHLARRLPGAVRLALAFHPEGGVSRGTATTIVENLHRGGVVRRGGVLTPVPTAWRTRTIDFGVGPSTAVTIPWGDVSTAFHSTHIPEIEVYAGVSRFERSMMIATRGLAGLLRSGPVQSFLKWRIRSGPPGPTEAQRARGCIRLWGEVEDASGARAVSRMRTPEGYAFTAVSAVAIAQRVLAGEAPPGFQTPSRAYGADFALAIPGVTRHDDPISRSAVAPA